MQGRVECRAAQGRTVVSDDPYKTLNVPKTATDDEIRRAYRKLAKKYHPDVNPGDRAAEERFKKISAAYDILGNSEKRARHDRGDAEARATHQRHRGFADAGGDVRYRTSTGGHGFDDLGDLFGDMFGHARRGGHSFGDFGGIGGDVNYRIEVDFLDAANGARKQVTMPDGRTLTVTIPAGLQDGQMLRLRGRGLPGPGTGILGDAYVEVKVRPHPVFTRKGSDIHMELPVTLAEAVLGGRVTVPTVSGPVVVTVPRGSNSGSVLRLRGKGVTDPSTKAVGDQLMTLKIMLPPTRDPELEQFIQAWARHHHYDPRRSS